MNTPEWLLVNDRRRPNSKQVKIAEGVYVVQKMLKTPGGLIRVTAVNQGGKLNDVHISGDFFFFPAASLMDLEQALEGRRRRDRADYRGGRSFLPGTGHRVARRGFRQILPRF